MPAKTETALLDIYTILLENLGHQHWWPADTAEEVIFGAILTQNITWKNVEQAIENLRQHRKLSFRALADTDEKELAELIRSSRYANQKARALKRFAAYFGEAYQYSIKRMAKQPLPRLREALLQQYGIGPETADSILLYALEKPVFVIDIYTKRIFSRHGFLTIETKYGLFQNLFMENLPEDVRLFNEYHALIVKTGNLFCKPTPRCDACPLKGW